MKMQVIRVRMEILAEIQERRSIRLFNSKPLDADKLDRILEAGRLAPSAKNRQEWRFIVIKDKKIRDKIANAAYGQEFISHAPIVMAACTTNIEYKMPNGQLSYPIDIGIAASFMMLQAEKEGCGTCCITTFDEQVVRDILTIPYLMRIVMLLVIGNYDTKPEPTTRKALKKIVSFNHW
jgi:nitroreductase